MNLYNFNPSLAAIDIPVPLQLQQAAQARAQAQAQAAAQPQNPGVSVGDAPQPIPPVGAPGGPLSVGPASWHGGTPGIPAAFNPTLALLGGPTPNWGMAAGSGLHAFNKALIDPANAPTPPPRPQNLTVQPSANQLLMQANASVQHDPGLIMRVINGLQGLGNGIGQAGQGIANGLGGIFKIGRASCRE